MAVISFKCPNCDGELIFDPESSAVSVENLHRQRSGPVSVEPSTKVNSAAIAERQGANYGSYQF